MKGDPLGKNRYLKGMRKMDQTTRSVAKPGCGRSDPMGAQVCLANTFGLIGLCMRMLKSPIRV